MKITTLLFLLLPFFALSQDMATHYKIYNTHTQKAATTDDIISNMATADAIFFGEEHNDSTGHYLEQVLFKKLVEKYPANSALLMEMFETDCQTVLDEYLNGFIREKNFMTDARVWHNYKDYRPLIEWAKANHIPIVAANAPGRYTNMTSKLGLIGLQQLSPTGKSYLPPLPIDTATGVYYEKFITIMGGHGAMGGMQLFQAQNLWDATMGWSIARFYKNHPGYKLMQINGGFHSEQKLGAVAQMLKYAPQARALNIAVYADNSFDNPNWDKFSTMGDYIILTDPKLPKTF